MRGWFCGAVIVLLCGVDADRARADLADAFRKPAFRQLGLAALGPALAQTVASAYPIASASSSVIYAYNPVLDTHERRADMPGPFFGERAETIGARQVSLSVAPSYIHFSTVNGEDLDHLPSRRSVRGRILYIPLRESVVLRNGRIATFLPVQVTADVDVTAYQLAASATYGVTSRLDVNLTVPLLYTTLDLSADGRAPDPRFPQFALPGGRVIHVRPSDDDDAAGIGDVLLRAKYLLLDGRLVDVATQLGLALPSGNEDDFQGSGTTRLQPTLILSHVVAQRFEPFLDVGVDCNADDVDRSVVQWAVGGTARVGDALTVALSFLGRNELAAQTDPIQLPFFFQIERNDLYDASVGLRWSFAEHGIVSANVIVPLNRDGLRADAIPALGMEYVF